MNKTSQFQAVSWCCGQSQPSFGLLAPQDESAPSPLALAQTAVASFREPAVVTPKPACTPADATQGSRRARLWELPCELHCAIIGVCFSIEALRRLVVKHYGAPCIVGDYEVHSIVVQACRTRTALIDVVQRELDKTFKIAIQNFQLAKTDAAVLALWQRAVSPKESGGQTVGGVAAALWASLTHPRADAPVRTKISHDIHMIQHRVAAGTRRDLQDLAQAQQLAAARGLELEASRAKLAQFQSQQLRENQTRAQQLTQTEVAMVGLKAQNAALCNKVETLRQSVAELDSREKLADRVANLSQQNAKLREQVAELLAKRAAPALPCLASEFDVPPAPTDKLNSQPINLYKKNVLCVGGRSKAVSSYRQAVERAGGRFVHHDGGLEHNQHRLDANLAAADCVVCQTAYISHTAYWLVKDYCKKTGKTCVYLDKPSVSTFVEGLSAFPKSLAPCQTADLTLPA